MTSRLSGLAYEGGTEGGSGVNVLIVHDDKRSGQPWISRIASAEGSAVVTPLMWEGAEPVDR
ncbi:hypothetical protein [Streptomyces sp. NPDC056194]|uniref:hypothetical protein n=1 Tax=unclassified Streptomyces TaxID=2593676 RepID=UPI0035D78F95